MLFGYRMTVGVGMRSAPQSQTLDRGIQVLHQLAAAGGEGLAVQRLADNLALHRSIVYRILRTFEDHGLVERTPTGNFVPGPGLAVLAASVARDLQSVALSELPGLAESARMTALVAVASGDDAVTLVSVEPRLSAGHVAYRPGTRHPLDRGAPGLAILAGGPPRPGERDEITEARRRGWARSAGEVIPGLTSVAAPVFNRSAGLVGSVAVVFAGDADEERLAGQVTATARRIGQRLD
jgi:DNA-binding IclR family transcriptional regulator